MSSERFGTVSHSIRQVTRHWTNKPAHMWRVVVFPKASRAVTRPICFCHGGSPQLSGGMTSPEHSHNRQPALTRDSRQPCYARHHLFAAFSCGGFPLLDSGRMESPAAGATGSAAPVALRDLRFRI